MGARVTDIAIIGGGIVGCSLAYDLTRQGISVTIFDRRELAQEASRASAGIISAPSPAAGDTLPIALRSFQRYPDLIREIEERAGFSTGWHKTGMTLLATDTETASVRNLVAWYLQHDIHPIWLDQGDLREREPATSDRFTGGLFQPDVASVILERVSQALALSAQQLGASIREHETIIDIEVEHARASAIRTSRERVPVDTVIVAAGAWSQMFSNALDWEISTVPVRGQMMAVSNVTPRVRSVLAHDGVYLVPRADGNVAAGATEEPESGFNNSVTPDGLSWLTHKASAIAPAVGNGKLISTWAGLRPGTPDGRPIIGPVPHLKNVWIVTGHFRSGALLAPGTSEIVTQSIASNNVDERLRPFAPKG